MTIKVTNGYIVKSVTESECNRFILRVVHLSNDNQVLWKYFIKTCVYKLNNDEFLLRMSVCIISFTSDVALAIKIVCLSPGPEVIKQFHAQLSWP